MKGSEDIEFYHEITEPKLNMSKQMKRVIKYKDTFYLSPKSYTLSEILSSITSFELRDLGYYLIGNPNFINFEMVSFNNENWKIKRTSDNIKQIKSLEFSCFPYYSLLGGLNYVQNQEIISDLLDFSISYLFFDSIKTNLKTRLINYFNNINSKIKPSGFYNASFYYYESWKNNWIHTKYSMYGFNLIKLIFVAEYVLRDDMSRPEFLKMVSTLLEMIEEGREPDIKEDIRMLYDLEDEDFLYKLINLLSEKYVKYKNIKVVE